LLFWQSSLEPKDHPRKKSADCGEKDLREKEKVGAGIGAAPTVGVLRMLLLG